VSCVGALGDGQNGRANGRGGWLDAASHAARGAGGAKNNRKHEIL
jgi:hypothetical protein